MDLKFSINKQKLSRTDTEEIVKCSDNYLRLLFTFKTSEWDNLVKFVLIKQSVGTTRLYLDSSDSVVLPASLCSDDELVFSVYGVDREDESIIRVTTSKIIIDLLDTTFTLDYTDTIPPTETDVVEAIYLRIQELEDNLGDVAFVDVDGTTLVINDESVQVKDDVFADKVHTHTEADITDLKNYSVVGHTHVKTDITDFPEVYTKTEVDNIVSSLLNRVSLDCDSEYVRYDEQINLKVFVVKNGVPVADTVVNFYDVEEE